MDSESRPEEIGEGRGLERVHTLCRHVGVGEYAEWKVLGTWPSFPPEYIQSTVLEWQLVTNGETAETARNSN